MPRTTKTWRKPNATPDPPKSACGPTRPRRRRGNSDDTGLHPTTSRHNRSQRRFPNPNPKSFITVTSNRRSSINPVASIMNARIARPGLHPRMTLKKMDTSRANSVHHDPQCSVSEHVTFITTWAVNLHLTLISITVPSLFVTLMTLNVSPSAFLT